MRYTVTIYDNEEDFKNGHRGITYDGLDFEEVVESIRFALEYGKAVTAIRE